MDLLLNAQENFFLKWIVRLRPGGPLLPRGVLCIPAFPLQLSRPPPTWNMVLPPNLHDTPWSTYRLLYHPWPALPDGVSFHVTLFPFLPLLLMLVTSAHPALSDMSGSWSCVWSGGWLCVCHRSGWPSPDGSLPAAGLHFHVWRSVFQVEGLGVPAMPPQFSCSQKLGLAWAINPDNHENATHSKTCHLSLALDYAVAAQDCPQAFTQANPVLLKVLWAAAWISGSPLSVTVSLQLKCSPSLLQTHPHSILPSNPSSSFTSFVSPFPCMPPTEVSPSWNLTELAVCLMWNSLHSHFIW